MSRRATIIGFVVVIAAIATGFAGYLLINSGQDSANQAGKPTRSRGEPKAGEQEAGPEMPKAIIPDKLPEKRACAYFSEETAKDILGSRASRGQDVVNTMANSGAATASTCEYAVGASSSAVVRLVQYKDEAGAEQYISSLQSFGGTSLNMAYTTKGSSAITAQVTIDQKYDQQASQKLLKAVAGKVK